MTLLPDLLARLDEAERKATSAPWFTNDERGAKYVLGPSSNECIPSPDVVATTRYSDRLTPDDNANMEFIALARTHMRELLDTIETLTRERDALKELINHPHNDDWFEGVRIEAAHQVERWGAEHDVGKTPLDWFWLIGYLAQKAASSEMKGDSEKAKHHTISTGAALLNWFCRMNGSENRMRPGIDSTEIEAAVEAERGAIIDRAIELTKKHGNPLGSDEEQGANDHGLRLINAIRARSTPVEGVSKP